MKKHCTVLAVVVLSLVAFGVVNASIGFNGVVDPNTYTVQVQSAIVYAPTYDSFAVTGWNGPGIDTFDFPRNIANWPDSVKLISTINSMPSISMFRAPVANVWYDFTYGGIVKPKALFFETAANLEEGRSAIGHPQRLSVSPSVVTGRMMIRLQPAGTGRPVVAIHDAVGNVVRSLGCTATANGFATATWNREDEFGRLVPEGVYFCRYAASGVVAVRKVLVTH